MSNSAMIFSIFGSLLLTAAVIVLVVSKRLTPGQSVLWIILAALILFLSIFPGIFFGLSGFIGAESAVSTMTFLGMVFFAGYSLYLSSRIASFERKMEKMAIFFAVSKRIETQKEDSNKQEGKGN